MPTSLDLSQKVELRLLAALVGEIHAAAPKLPFFLAGAMARDVILQYGHGIDTGRRTADVDLALAMESWRHYEELRTALIRTGRFSAVPEKVHKLIFGKSLEVDFLPFGPIERADRTLAWPPDGAFVMNVFGFREVHATTIAVALPDGASCQVASLPALALLKLFAWTDRRLHEPGKDAHDLKLILRHYLDAGNAERLYTEASKLLENPNFDYEAAGAWLLGHDMARLVDPEGHSRVASLIAAEADARGSLRLVGDLKLDADKALVLLAALNDGFTADRV